MSFGSLLAKPTRLIARRVLAFIYPFYPLLLPSALARHELVQLGDGDGCVGCHPRKGVRQAGGELRKAGCGREHDPRYQGQLVKLCSSTTPAVSL
jgi:hypothetical protein